MITTERITKIDLFYVQREMPDRVWISVAHRLASYEQAKAFADSLDDVGALRIVLERTSVYICEDS